MAPADAAIARGSRSGCCDAQSNPAAKALSLPCRTSAPFLANFFRIPARSDSRPTPSQLDSRPSTTEFFARSVPAVFFAISPMGTGIASQGTTPARGTRSGGTFVAAS